MRKKRGTGGDHGNQERWLLTYADLITLLLGLFVILYAMSKIDVGRYRQVVDALGGAFGSERGPLTGGGGVVDEQLPVMQGERAKLTRQLRSALRTDSASAAVSVSENERGVTVHIMEKLLFASGEAVVKESALGTLDTLAMVLRRLPNDIRVEGHTDNVPIRTEIHPSNWHLSVARAVNVGYYLIERHHLIPDRVSVVGYAEYRPLVSNSTPENRAKNRRVDIVIVTNNGDQGGNTVPSPSGN